MSETLSDPEGGRSYENNVIRKSQGIRIIHTVRYISFDYLYSQQTRTLLGVTYAHFQVHSCPLKICTQVIERRVSCKTWDQLKVTIPLNQRHCQWEKPARKVRFQVSGVGCQEALF